MKIVHSKSREIWFPILLLLSGFRLSNGRDRNSRDTENNTKQLRSEFHIIQTGNVAERKQSQYLQHQNVIDITNSHNVIYDGNDSKDSILLNPVNILLCDADSSVPGRRVYHFDVDHTVNMLLVKVTAGQKCNATPQYTVYYPSGNPVDSDVENVTVLINSKLKSRDLIISDTTPGKWKIELEDNVTNSVIVRGNSIVDFSAKFVDDYGYTIKSQPLAETTANLVIEIYGKELIQNVSRVWFISPSGDTLTEISTLRPVGRDGTLYAVECIIPSKEFRIGILGYDTFDMAIQRLQDKIVEPLIRSTSMTQLHTEQVTPTSVAQTTDLISSVPVTKSLRVQTTDMVSTETVTTGQEISTFDVESSSKFIDIHPPTFSTISCVDKCDGNFKCSKRKWMVKFKVQDNESGIHRISVEDETKSSISFESYTDGVTNTPVHGNVSTNCCNSKMVIIVEDVQGNRGRFPVKYHHHHHKPDTENNSSSQSASINIKNGISFMEISGILIGSLSGLLLVVIIVTVSIEFHKKVRVFCRRNDDIRVSRRLALKLDNIPDTKDRPV